MLLSNNKRGLVMRFTKIGVERGDCTYAYKVDGYSARTVREFIDEVLHERPQEFGYIAVGGMFISHPCCEYRYGKLLSTLSDDLLDKRIVRVDADGGWSNMDYALYVE